MKEKVRMMKKEDANAPETKKAVEEMMALQKMVKELKLKFGDDEKKKLPTCDKDALEHCFREECLSYLHLISTVVSRDCTYLSLSLTHTHTQHHHTHTRCTIRTRLARSRQTCFTCGEIISF